MALEYDPGTGTVMGRLTRMTPSERAEIDSLVESGRYEVLSTHPSIEEIEKMSQKMVEWDALSSDEQKKRLLKIRNRVLSDVKI